jgi:vitamin K-dependent gamma-carboxylase
MTDLVARLRSLMFERRDAAGLAAFRVLVGVLGAVSALRFLHYGWVDAFFVEPRFYFQYWLAPFAVPLGKSEMHALFWLIAGAGVFVALGLFYRVAIAVFFFAFAYVQLIDVSNYLNHYYLLSLLTLLMAFMPLGKTYGLDGYIGERRGAVARTTVPRWCYAILKLQIGLVYSYAGLAKVTEDWLVHAQPLSIWLASRTSMPFIGPLLAEPWAPHAMAWAGCLFDLTVVWWLLWRKSRPWAFAAVLIFHALTRYLFPIGMFPFIMIAGATIFFEPEWPRRLLGLRGPLRHEATTVRPCPGPGRYWPIGAAALGLYAMFQLLFPLRAHAYGGDVHWHEQGMRFSWRVMVREKNASVTYLVDDLRTGRTVEIKPRRYLDARQERELGTQPDLIAQLARHIARERERETGNPVRVRAEVLANLNGRRARLLVDPTVDLAKAPDGFGKASWITSSPTGEPPLLRASR